jgi:hypothetical protein
MPWEEMGKIKGRENVPVYELGVLATILARDWETVNFGTSETCFLKVLLEEFAEAQVLVLSDIPHIEVLNDSFFN